MKLISTRIFVEKWAAKKDISMDKFILVLQLLPKVSSLLVFYHICIDTWMINLLN